LVSGAWQELAERLRASAPFTAACRSLGTLDRLPLAGVAWVAPLLAADLGRPLLAVVPREGDALVWLEMARLAGEPAVWFSAPSLSPYQEADVSLALRAQEAVALDTLLAGEVRTVLCTPRALFRRLPRPDSFRGRVRTVRPGDELSTAELAEHLVRCGFERRDLVSEVGEFALRGGVFDLFPPGGELPVRLDLLGDTVESVRAFSPDDQRSSAELAAARILPLQLFDASPQAAGRLADALAGTVGHLGPEAAERLEALRRRGRAPGWENLLPSLEEETTDLFELAGDPLRLAVAADALRQEVAAHAERLAADYAARRERGLAVPPPETLERDAGDVLELIDGSELRAGDVTDGGARVDFEATLTDQLHGQLPRFPREVETARARGERLIVVSSAEHRGRVERLCDGFQLPLGRGGVEVVEGELRRGFRLPAAGVVLFGEPQLFAPLGPPPRRRARHAAFLGGLRDLRVGDYVVHADHGIGRFLGLRSVAEESSPSAAGAVPPTVAAAAGPRADVEVMELGYAEGRTLLLPLARLDAIQRYSGIEGAAPKLDRLGGTSWVRTKERVRRGMRKLAIDLLELYAQRQLARAPAMPGGSDLQAQFEAAFDYEETPDQLDSIAAIRGDLAGERPMDRLLCGDVGFGKTEVAMRAALTAVEAGWQVVVLAPTTILADQHLETFRRRFDGFPVRVEMLSRGRSARESRDIVARLKGGEIDVLIGTHRLLSRDVELPRLGLLVVDEEQRFGVAQKERLKSLKKNVHVLSLSATPVPRTLQLALAGVRDLSVIETPPRDRLAVETVIVPYSGELVRQAIEDELERGGQVYYVYNRVERIEEIAGALKELLPSLRLTIGHGQMDETELVRRMHAFKEGEFDLLLATSIIENGIDISNVNTMIVHRADRFGLAQLYQLRGRVGRGGQLAYCYLTIPPDRTLSDKARKRLSAIREFTELGAGFRVAARDLEIRGAGNLLGAEQSGQIVAVGIETYLKMLDETVRELRGEPVVAPVSTAIDLPISVRIPDSYVADANLRMELYQRIAAAESSDDEIVAELRDRFGAPPPPVLRLVEIASLKRLAERLRVQSISTEGRALKLRLRSDAVVDVDRLIELVARTPDSRFSPSGVLTLADVPADRMIGVTREILEQIAAPAGEGAPA